MNTDALLSNAQRVLAEVARLTAVWNATASTYVLITPRVTFRSLGHRAGVAHVQHNFIEINSDLLAVAPEGILTDTVPHELAHIIHYALRPQDFARGKRLAHGRYWQMIARILGLKDPTRCAQWATADVQKAAGLKQRRRHAYKCLTCGGDTVVHAGPKHHAKIQRGVRFQIKACKHFLLPEGYIGVVA